MSPIPDPRDGQYTEIDASIYVLAAGAIETPRLLLHSKNSAHLDGLGNPYGQVGRYFMETVMSFLSIRLASPIKTYRGPPIDARIWDYNYPADDKTGGFVLGISGYLNPNNGPVGHALDTSGIGRAHQQRVRHSFGRDINLFGIAEQQPISSNRVFLSPELDNIGVPKVKVHSAYSEQDMNTIAQMNFRLQQWARASDTDYAEKPRSTVAISSATHVGGTCRMGSAPENSVVDGFGKLHGQNNVYITDGSILPTQGAGDSPSLTIQALALRTAERIAVDLKSQAR